MPRQYWTYPPLRHICMWLGSWAAMYLLVRFGEGARAAFVVTTPMMLAGPLPVYTHFAALDRFFERRRYLAYGLSLVVIVFGSALWAEFVHSLIDRDPNSHTNGLGIAVFFLTFSTGFRYFKRGITQQYRLQEAESKQIQTEMALLRSQVNPHFLFNTLNSLYALSLEQSHRLPEVILKLSELMRYLLDSSHRKTVPLAEEIRFVESYVELEKLRLDKDADVRVRVVGDPDARLVAPMLMVPLVENCFKHGLGGNDKACRIHIDIEMAEGQVRFAAENGKGEQISVENSSARGEGLRNLERRLALLYPGRHRLTIVDEEDRHSVEVVLWP
jgi:two-component system LytT family sensor kinase